MELPRQVRDARHQANLTQGELAQAAGVGRKDVWRLENGHNVTLQTLEKIVKALPNKTLRLVAEQTRQSEGSVNELHEDAQERLRRLADEVKGDKPPQAKEMSLLRTLLELIIELTGGR